MPLPAPLHAAIDHPAESTLFDDTLSCSLVQPGRFTPGACACPPAMAEALLQALAQAEDARGSDEGEEHGELPQAIQRLESMLDLMMGLLSRLVRQSQPALPLLPMRWSVRGVRLDLTEPLNIAVGQAGCLQLEPASWLGDRIELPVVVLASAVDETGQHLWLQHDDVGPGLAEALERHLFRIHRRQVADARRHA